MGTNTQIKAARGKKGLTQEELAAQMGITRQTVINWEKGVSAPSVDEVKIMSKILNVSVEELSSSAESAAPEEIYRKIVEGGTEYYLIPKSIFQEKYILVALDQFNKEQAKWDRDKNAFDRLLDLFEQTLGQRESDAKPQGAKNTK